MNAQQISNYLLDSNAAFELLVEASVHLPRLGTKWVAVFTGPESGKQVWRSTGLTDRDAALAQTRKWEAEARMQRQALGKQPRRAAVRVRRSSAESGGFGPLTQREVAALMKLSERAVRNIEKRALEKLKNHPALRGLWDEMKMLETTVVADALTAAEGGSVFSASRFILPKMLARPAAADWLPGDFRGAFA